MAIERTFSMIKPDATKRNLTGAITKMLEDAGLRVVASKRVWMSKREAEGFYAVHKERPFFGELVDNIVAALGMKYNVLIFSDSDIFTGTENFKNLKMLIAKYPRNVFVLFDKQSTYVTYRKAGGPPTPNVSHM